MKSPEINRLCGHWAGSWPEPPDTSFTFTASQTMAFVAPISAQPRRVDAALSVCYLCPNRTHLLRHGWAGVVEKTRVGGDARGIRPSSMRISEGSPIPDSFEAACEEARKAMTAAMSSGARRMFVELDTTNGDATYTQLKTTTPTVLALTEAFAGSPIQLVFPDAGAAALARRDWDSNADTVKLVGLEQFERRDDDAAIILVVPRASEVDRLAALVSDAGDVPLIMVNPDLVDMGVTGLSLNARRLRENVIDLFDTVYYLRVFPWGVLYRNFPDKWSVWVDDDNETSGFRCIATLDQKPTNDALDELLDADSAQSGGEEVGPLQKVMKGLERFLKVYTKG